MNEVELLKKELGERKVKDDPEYIEKYSLDESGIMPGKLPLAIVFAENTQDIVKVMELAYQRGFPVTPRGAGTGLTGGAVPLEGGVVLSLERMNKIVDIDTKNLVGVVEPGVITEEFQKEVENLNLFYPPDPASLDSCTLGGNVAENAGGPRALKYGVTKHYVLELEVVLPGGQLMRFGKPTKKWVVGYDLPSLITGSEGTLGVISQITFRLLPKPEGTRTVLALFEDEIKASETVSKIVASHILPSVLEFMDRKSIEIVEEKIPTKLPENTGALLLIEVDGWEHELDSEMERIAEICFEMGALEIFAADTKREREKIWTARRILYPTLEENFKKVRSEDIVVPRSLIPEAVRRVYEIEKKTGVEMATFGHIGDGNLHVNLLYEEEDERVERAIVEIYKMAVELGGTISGEHGIGALKKPHIKLEQEEDLLRLERAIKNLFDPKNILNPGKIFP